MDIYWIKDKKSCGPRTVPDIIALVQLGELSPDTLGWHAGCTQWMPLKDLPALADFLQKAQAGEKQRDAEPPPKNGQDRNNQPEEPTNEHPMEAESGQRLYLPTIGQRVAAHLVDASLYAALVSLALYASNTPFHLYLMPSHPLFWLPMVLGEALCLHHRRATPGMALFGILLSTYSREMAALPPMDFGRVLRRSFQVYIWGTGMYIFPMSLLMPLLSYYMMRKQGITLWDFRCLTMPVQKQPAPPLRMLLACSVILGSFYTTSLCMQRWMPEIMELASKESPGMVHWLEQWMPPQPTQGEKSAETQGPLP